MVLHKRFRDFRDWCPQPSSPFSAKLKRYSAPIAALIMVSLCVAAFSVFSASLFNQPVPQVPVVLFSAGSPSPSSEPSGTIYIKPDGSIEPSKAPMQRLGNIYQLTSNIAVDNGTVIEVQKDNVIVDGAGYALQGQGTVVGGLGVYVAGQSNVTIENCLITNFVVGIDAENSVNLNLIQNNITTCTYENGVDILNSTDALVANNTVVSYANIDANQNSGVYLRDSLNSTVSGNKVMGGWIGISFEDTNDSVVSDNSVTQSQIGIQLEGADGNQVFGNNVFGTVEAISAEVYPDAGVGIRLYGNADNNQIYGNSIANNGDGMDVWFASSSNLVYNNNFQNNTLQVSISSESSVCNFWDNGTSGNYWSDYRGQGTYIIDANNIDHHPLTQADVAAKAQTLLSALPIACIAFVAVSVSVAVLFVFYLIYHKRQTRMPATLPSPNLET